MKTMAISEFKAHALQVLNEVAKSQEGIVITKRGNRSFKWSLIGNPR